MPAPNVIAGVLIGIVNDGWLTVLGASCCLAAHVAVPP